MIIAVKTFLGIILALLGLIILLTPFTPGSILLVIGFDMIIGDKWQWWTNKKQRILLFFNKKFN